MSNHLKLGYIGLGHMGTPMAKKMVEWPGGLTIYDIRPEAMTLLAERGALQAKSVADVAVADIISVTVLDDEQVRTVVGELAPHAKPGTIIAIHSTISDTTAEELARDWEPRDIHVIDAPISGGGRAARFGQLATMVGASAKSSPASKSRSRIGRSWWSMPVHPGAGTRMKLARNLITFTSFAAVGEAWKLAEAAGLNLQDLGNVVRHTDKLTGGAGCDHVPRRHERS